MNSSQIIELGINIDHVATLRNARGTVYPDPLRAAALAEEAGADLITLHLREDRRHIKDVDLLALRPLIKTRMNLECAVTPEMIDIACQVKPHDVCLVPEKREEVTTEGGLDVISYFAAVKAATKKLMDAGIRVSLFIDPEEKQIQAAKDTGATVVELHTGRYADLDGAKQAKELERIRNRFKEMEDNDRQWIGIIRTAVKYERNPLIPYNIAHTRRDFQLRRELALELKDVRNTYSNVI